MPSVLSYTNAFPGIPTPQHLSGQTKVQNFIYPGALQPIQTTPIVLGYRNAFLIDNTLARLFNGTSDHIACGSYGAGTLQPTSAPITIACWFKPRVSANSDLAGNFNAFNSGYCLQYVGLSNAMQYYTGGGHYLGSAVPAVGVWSHVAMVVTTTVAGYFNGVADGSAVAFSGFSYNFGSQNSRFSIGSFDDQVSGLGSFFDGQIADVSIWTVALTPTQIASLASGVRASTIAPGSILGQWPITGASPEPDQSGNGNNGTLSGTKIIGGPNLLQPLSGGIFVPQHSTGKTQVQSFFYPGALQPFTPPVPPFFLMPQILL